MISKIINTLLNCIFKNMITFNFVNIKISINNYYIEHIVSKEIWFNKHCMQSMQQ